MTEDLLTISIIVIDLSLCDFMFIEGVIESRFSLFAFRIFAHTSEKYGSTECYELQCDRIIDAEFFRDFLSASGGESGLEKGRDIHRGEYLVITRNNRKQCKIPA
jgi:hypothetical protein